MILVTGATGNIGGQLLGELAGRGEPLRALVRDPSTASLPDGVQATAGDLSDPESLSAALQGVDKVFLMPGYTGVAAAAQAAGVTRIVQLSGGSAGSADPSNAVTRYMARSEAEVRETGCEFTFLRPAAFMSNALRWLPQLQAGDVVRAPFADVPLACVDPGDIAAVAAVALAEDGHDAMIYRPTGPESLLPEQQVDILGAALGRPLRFQGQPNAEARRSMLETTPAAYVAAFFDFYVNGSIDESTVRPTVQDVTSPPSPARDAPHTCSCGTPPTPSRASAPPSRPPKPRGGGPSSCTAGTDGSPCRRGNCPATRRSPTPSPTWPARSGAATGAPAATSARAATSWPHSRPPRTRSPAAAPSPWVITGAGCPGRDPRRSR